MSSVKGVLKVAFYFDTDQLCEKFGRGLSDVQLTKIAIILSANIECIDEHRDEVVDIERWNFNDCYYDMMDSISNQIRSGLI